MNLTLSLLYRGKSLLLRLTSRRTSLTTHRGAKLLRLSSGLAYRGTELLRLPGHLLGRRGTKLLRLATCLPDRGTKLWLLLLELLPLRLLILLALWIVTLKIKK